MNCLQGLKIGGGEEGSYYCGGRNLPPLEIPLVTALILLNTYIAQPIQYKCSGVGLHLTSWLAGKSKTNPTIKISFNSSGLKLLFLAKKCWKPFAFLSLSWQIAGVKPRQMLVPILKHRYVLLREKTTTNDDFRVLTSNI